MIYEQKSFTAIILMTNEQESLVPELHEIEFKDEPVNIIRCKMDTDDIFVSLSYALILIIGKLENHINFN